MKAILLVAGYATRLYPLTKDKPKTLLEVGGKAILGHVLEKLAKTPFVGEVILVSNHKFADQLQAWVDNYQYSIPITILNDGSTSNSNRLGAIGDLNLAIKEYKINDDIIVLAGDNLFDFELTEFIEFYHHNNSDCIAVHQRDDLEFLRTTGVAEIDSDNKVISFVEKPQDPKSNLAVPPFYIYQTQTLPLVEQYIAEGNNPDAPGNFIPWLIEHRDVYAFEFLGQAYDVGTVEIYEEINRIFSRR